jgi:uncharacterized membrane protein (UPF0182 family)
MNLKSRGTILIILFAVIGLSASKTLVHLLTEVWWFNAVGFAEVFWTKLTWQVVVWLVTFAAYALFLWVNYVIAHRIGTYSVTVLRHHSRRLLGGSDLETFAHKFSHYAVLAGIVLVSLVAASAAVPAWETILKYLNRTDFGSRDPIFRREIGFYIFQLPLYDGIWQWLCFLLLSGLGMVGLIYFLKGTLRLDGNQRLLLAGKAKVHFSLLLAALAFLIAVHFWLQRYHLLYSTQGVAFGAGYTDVHGRLLANWVMAILSVGLAALFLVSLRRNNWGLPLAGFGLWLGALFLVGGIYPWLQQGFLVEPNELTKEKPYIAHNIQFTQRAYRLDGVQQENFAAQANLNRQILEDNRATIHNIRLWDYRPLLITYRQLQEIRLYYHFQDVDVDRYTINGNYQQVMLSARELAISQVPKEAQTWVNQRLKYTHGYGLVMSPVNEVTSDGLPEFYIKDIPPVSTVNLPVKQPAIYYGEETEHYIFTGATTPEFDYPLGDKNAFTNYQGKGGVSIPSVWQRLAYAYDLGSLQILISNYFTNQSRIHYYRQIQERVRHVAPFLRFDSDPYLVLIGGKLQWLVDGYTVSDRYPYSEPVRKSPNVNTILTGENIENIVRGNVNYIRNPVKVLIDAYDGTMQFFVVDETDPVLQTYRRIFPSLFKDYQTIPPTVKAHFRYPLDLFKIQAQMYLSYHMSDPEVFYNREDLWRFPLQTYEGNEQVMEPYYMIVRLPGEEKEGFILILPFTPANKDNTVAWMAARSNGKEYGKLFLYEFPKQKLVFGPRQIEARIDQETTISQQFTLWSQSGSKVIRGDLLVIPIEQSLLYVEPIYLRAEQGELPELKRVIVVYDKSVVMEESLEKSLAVIFGGSQVEKEASKGVNIPAVGEVAKSIKSALEIYQKAEAAARQGNWAEYGKYQQELSDILQKLNQQAQ